jgi:hypothetical protein
MLPSFRREELAVEGKQIGVERFKVEVVVVAGVDHELGVLLDDLTQKVGDLVAAEDVLPFVEIQKPVDQLLHQFLLDAEDQLGPAEDGLLQ